MYNVAVITISTSSFNGDRVDTCGPNIENVLKKYDYNVSYRNIIPDDYLMIKNELLKMISDSYDLVLTLGGTGFSKTDVTPEATKAVIEKDVPGIPEMMRFLNYAKTKNSFLSRSISGIAKNSLIINLPGSKKAAEESLNAIIDIINHGLDVLKSERSLNCGR